MERNLIPPTGPSLQAHSNEEWAEVLARTIAHLAAQLTMSQLRLRALATELEQLSVVDAAAVRARLSALAASETGTYLRENLGPALSDMVDIETLEAEIITFLQA